MCENLYINLATASTTGEASQGGKQNSKTTCLDIKAINEQQTVWIWIVWPCQQKKQTEIFASIPLWSASSHVLQMPYSISQKPLELKNRLMRFLLNATQSYKKQLIYVDIPSFFRPRHIGPGLLAPPCDWCCALCSIKNRKLHHKRCNSSIIFKPTK